MAIQIKNYTLENGIQLNDAYLCRGTARIERNETAFQFLVFASEAKSEITGNRIDKINLAFMSDEDKAAFEKSIVDAVWKTAYEYFKKSPEERIRIKEISGKNPGDETEKEEEKYFVYTNNKSINFSSKEKCIDIL